MIYYLICLRPFKPCVLHSFLKSILVTPSSCEIVITTHRDNIIEHQNII